MVSEDVGLLAGGELAGKLLQKGAEAEEGLRPVYRERAVSLEATLRSLEDVEARLNAEMKSIAEVEREAIPTITDIEEHVKTSLPEIVEKPNYIGLRLPMLKEKTSVRTKIGSTEIAKEKLRRLVVTPKVPKDVFRPEVMEHLYKPEVRDVFVKSALGKPESLLKAIEEYKKKGLQQHVGEAYGIGKLTYGFGGRMYKTGEAERLPAGGNIKEAHIRVRISDRYRKGTSVEGVVKRIAKTLKRWEDGTKNLDVADQGKEIITKIEKSINNGIAELKKKVNNKRSESVRGNRIKVKKAVNGPEVEVGSGAEALAIMPDVAKVAVKRIKEVLKNAEEATKKVEEQLSPAKRETTQISSILLPVERRLLRLRTVMLSKLKLGATPRLSPLEKLKGIERLEPKQKSKLAISNKSIGSLTSRTALNGKVATLSTGDVGRLSPKLAVSEPVVPDLDLLRQRKIRLFEKTPRQSTKKQSTKKKRGKKNKAKYTPSLAAIEFDIKSKLPKIDETGLKIRPVVIK